MSLLDASYEVSPMKILRYLLKHMVPLFWGVSLIPYYVGWVFATRKLFPTLISDVLTSTTSSLAIVNEFWIFVIGFIVMGPFLGGSTLLYNDYWDWEIDKDSLRKGLFPLPQGFLKPKTALKVSIMLMSFALIFSVFVSLLFTLIVGVCLALSIAYSTPPVRLKTRAGLDILTNAVGAGVLCSLAGWIVVRSIFDYPIYWGVVSIFTVSAIYTSTLLADYQSDKKNNVMTLAVKLGDKNTYYLAIACLIIGGVIFVIMGLTSYIISPEFIYLTWPISVSLPISYWAILRKRTFKNVLRSISALTALLTLGNVLILLYYTGIWKIS